MIHKNQDRNQIKKSNPKQPKEDQTLQSFNTKFKDKDDSGENLTDGLVDLEEDEKTTLNKSGIQEGPKKDEKSRNIRQLE